MISKSWNLEAARVLLIGVEKALNGSHHVGLLGSVLLHSKSEKDLDIVIYPHHVVEHFGRREHTKIRNALHTAGLHRVADFDMVMEEWRKKGSPDTKMVEMWRTEDGRRVDVFYLR